MVRHSAGELHGVESDTALQALPDSYTAATELHENMVSTNVLDRAVSPECRVKKAMSAPCANPIKDFSMIKAESKTAVILGGMRRNTQTSCPMTSGLTRDAR